MASLAQRLATNVPGDLYVDGSCIDCGTCRWMAPETFDARQGHSRVHHQPAPGSLAERAALQALLACPTTSIGTRRRDAPLREVARDFPRRLLADTDLNAEVYHCGFHAAESFGAASYLLRHPAGNVLVDSPRFSAPLARRLEDLGGVRWMFLTHRDDVADHARFQRHFGCTRILHEGDAHGELRHVEHLLTGTAPVPLAEDLLLIPTPGHTRGSVCLLYREAVLFSGDTLAGTPGGGGLRAFRDACWYDWSVQRASLAYLGRWSFSAVLPGHGWPCQLPPPELAAALQSCIAEMGVPGV